MILAETEEEGGFRSVLFEKGKKRENAFLRSAEGVDVYFQGEFHSSTSFLASPTWLL